MKRHRLVFDCV